MRENVIAMGVRTQLVRIGNSKGVRIPKGLLQQAGLIDKVDMEAEKGHLVIRAAVHPREGWEEDFRRMAAAGDDRMLDGDLPPQTEWDYTEWEW